MRPCWQGSSTAREDFSADASAHAAVGATRSCWLRARFRGPPPVVDGDPLGPGPTRTALSSLCSVTPSTSAGR